VKAGAVVAVFCGSRYWTHREAIGRDVEALADGSLVVVNGEPGAARIAWQEARARGIHFAVVPALKHSYGVFAPSRRDEAICLLRPDVVYAYPLGDEGTGRFEMHAEDVGISVR
jgi:hypothetical protein